MATTAEIFRANQSLFGSVPVYREAEVCDCCFGPVSGGYRRCFGCNRLFTGGAPPGLATNIVPMTVVADPSPWYTRLATYKTFGVQHRAVLASLIFTYLVKHGDDITAALDGEPDFLTIVPSTRGRPIEEQPLRTVLRMVQPLEQRFRPVLHHVPGCVVPRNGYRPECFTADRAEVAGTRALVVEDTWVTGAKAVSAAGALVEAGASSVIVVPVARRVQPNSGFHPANHPYFAAINRPYDVSFWPPSARDDPF